MPNGAVVRALCLVHFYTMLTTDRIYALLEQKRLELGLSQAQVSDRALGKPDSAAFQNIRRGASPSVEKLEALARALDLDFYFGPRRGDVDQQLSFGVAESGPIRPISGGLPAGGYRLIPWHSRARKMTPQPLAFHERLLSDLGVTVENLAVVAVEGTHHLLDMRAPRAGFGSWAIMQDGNAAIARLRFDGAMVIVVPEGGAPPFTASPAEANGMVLGKVVWSGYAPVSAA